MGRGKKRKREREKRVVGKDLCWQTSRAAYQLLLLQLAQLQVFEMLVRLPMIIFFLLWTRTKLGGWKGRVSCCYYNKENLQIHLDAINRLLAPFWHVQLFKLKTFFVHILYSYDKCTITGLKTCELQVYQNEIGFFSCFAVAQFIIYCTVE